MTEEKRTIDDNTIEISIHGSFNGKEYAARVVNIMGDGVFNSEQIFENASWLSLMMLVTIEKHELAKLTVPPSKLKDFEIPRLIKCANSPLYEKIPRGVDDD